MAITDTTLPVQVDAWSVSLPGPVTPRLGIILALQISWHRMQEYARMLKEQLDESAGGTSGMEAARGLIGSVLDSSIVIGGTYETTEAIRALTILEAEERDRFARLCKTAYDMGIQPREWEDMPF